MAAGGWPHCTHSVEVDSDEMAAFAFFLPLLHSEIPSLQNGIRNVHPTFKLDLPILITLT